MKLAIMIVLALAFSGCSKAPVEEPLFVFDQVVIAEGGEATITAIWPHGLRGSGGIDWIEDYRTNDGLGWLQATAETTEPGLTITASTGPYYEDGLGVQVTLFAWDKGVELMASTLDEENSTQLVPWISDFFQSLPVATYYFGTGEVPEGMQELPESVRGIAPLAHAALLGQPVGGVISLQVPEDQWEYGPYIGDLYITAQIDALIEAQS
jgi:hypothetical protein